MHRVEWVLGEISAVPVHAAWVAVVQLLPYMQRVVAVVQLFPYMQCGGGGTAVDCINS